MKRKVLFYTPFLSTGGLDKASIDYIKLFKEEGIDYDVAIDYDFGDRNYFVQEIPKDTNYYFVKSEKISKLIYKFRTLGKEKAIYNIFLYFLIIFFDFYYYHFKLKKIIKEQNYTTIISFFQFMPSYVTKNKKINNIIYLHGSVEHYFLGIRKFFKKQYLKKLKKYNYIVTVCEDLKKQLLSIYPQLNQKKVLTIYNPINFDEIIKKGDENLENLSINDKQLLKQRFICTICRIDEGQKDITTLINAYEKCYMKNNKLEKLYILGTGPDEDRLKKVVVEKKLDKQILFLGMKMNPYIWLKRSELFILSSKFEGFGLVLVEAMIFNKPIISSDCKVGPSEILENGKIGKLFNVGDSDYLELLLSDYKNLTLNELDYKKSLKRFSKIEMTKNIKKILER
ncbi:MAG: glycosyltransferase [Cetobacterium sp.]